MIAHTAFSGHDAQVVGTRLQVPVSYSPAEAMQV